MSTAPVDRFARIPNNVDLAGDKKLQRALEEWQPKFMSWWRDMGPSDFYTKDVYLRTAVSVDKDGWAHFDHVKLPDYRFGIFLTPFDDKERVQFGDRAGEACFQEVPGEFRNSLRRIVVTQADTEPASVEQQRLLGHTAPSLYDLRNLFQVNVEEGRHLWAMVYVLMRHFGRDGRDESEELLNRRSGDADKPRILGAFNQPCSNWLDFFAFTMFTDRDGKYQLAALAESGFEPLARSCRFMLTEEAHHLFVGETGIERIVRRTAEIMKEGKDPRTEGTIPLKMIQKTINFWFSYSLDLFGGEISSNAADYFAASLKGRYKEADQYEDHTILGQSRSIPVVENGRLIEKEVPLRNALNEILRDEYVKDCERALARWNKTIEEKGQSERLFLPSRRFHRHQGEYSRQTFDPQGQLLIESEFESRRSEWLPTAEDRGYVQSLMKPVHEPGKFANWIAAPVRGINGLPLDFEYVRL